MDIFSLFRKKKKFPEVSDIIYNTSDNIPIQHKGSIICVIVLIRLIRKTGEIQEIKNSRLRTPIRKLPDNLTDASMIVRHDKDVVSISSITTIYGMVLFDEIDVKKGELIQINLYNGFID